MLRELETLHANAMQELTRTDEARRAHEIAMQELERRHQTVATSVQQLHEQIIALRDIVVDAYADPTAV